MGLNALDLRWQMVRDRWPHRVKNSSGSVLPPFSVVLITSATAVNNEIQYTVRQPNAASTDFNWNGYLVTGPFQIGAASTAEGLATTLIEPNYVRYNNANTPAINQIWGPKHSQNTLERYYYGFEILGGNTTFNGNAITLARWVGIPWVLVKLDGTSTKNSSTATGSVWAGAAGSEADTTMDISGIYNKFATVASTKFAGVVLNGGVPQLTAGEC